MGELYLVYINELNTDWEDNNLYEFIFSETKHIEEKLEGEYWDVIPASRNPTPPDSSVVSYVGLLKTEDIVLDTIYNSDTFSVYDSIDGVVALGWEDLMESETYPENRLVFPYGDELEEVKNKLYSRDLILETKYEKNEQ